MKYDDASWHCGGDFPQDLEPEAGATHIGMFVAWAMLNGLAGPIHTEDFPDDLSSLEERNLTPGAWFLTACDGKFNDEDLTEVGNGFARAYYADETGLKSADPSFLFDYVAIFQDCEDTYRVPDTWESYDRLAARVSRRYAMWREQHPNLG